MQTHRTAASSSAAHTEAALFRLPPTRRELSSARSWTRASTKNFFITPILSPLEP